MININNLSYSYYNTIPVFSNLNLSLDSHHIYGLLGKNGVGKSTLLKILMGFLFPKQGNCQIDHYIPSQRERNFLMNIYLVPQELYIPQLTIKDYLHLYEPFYPSFNREQFYAALAEFVIPKLTYLPHLSHGQKKKFYIAFALASGASLILLDEPTNGLDIPSKTQFRKLIATHAEMGKTVIISTHEIHDVQHLVDALVIINEGKIVLNAEVENINRLLQMVTQTEMPDEKRVLYYEKSLGGYRVIQQARDDKETDMDFELLFNAMLSTGDAIHKLFLGEKNET